MKDNFILLVKNLVEKTPNDYDLGKEIRVLVDKLKNEENQKNTKEEWGSTNGY